MYIYEIEKTLLYMQTVRIFLILFDNMNIFEILLCLINNPRIQKIFSKNMEHNIASNQFINKEFIQENAITRSHNQKVLRLNSQIDPSNMIPFSHNLTKGLPHSRLEFYYKSVVRNFTTLTLYELWHILVDPYPRIRKM